MTQLAQRDVKSIAYRADKIYSTSDGKHFYRILKIEKPYILAQYCTSNGRFVNSFVKIKYTSRSFHSEFPNYVGKIEKSKRFKFLPNFSWNFKETFIAK